MTYSHEQALVAEVVQANQGRDRKGLGPEIYLTRRPVLTIDAQALAASQWRQVIAKAPIVRNCISTLILQIMATPYDLQSEDEEQAEYYQDIFDHANGEDLPSLLSRVIQDTLTVPFGGAIEALRDSDGLLRALYHVDGGTLAPTYDEQEPYVQFSPYNQQVQVRFAAGELLRLPWRMRSDLAGYDWTYTPAMDCYAAIESLIRSDVFYNTLLSDTPPPGILDLLDMTKEEATEWATSFRATFEGIDRFKVPVLYDHKEPARWLPFQEAATTRELPEIIRRYAEIVCSAHGLSIVDLGLYEYAQTKAGSVAQLSASRRQGLGALYTKSERLFNGLVLPKEVHFAWKPIDSEDAVRRANAQKLRLETMEKAIDKGIINERQAAKMLTDEGIFVIDMSLANEPVSLPPPPPTPEQGEEEQIPVESGAEEQQQSLYALVLDDRGQMAYDWERCEVEPALIARAEAQGTDWRPRAFESDDPRYLGLRRVLEAEFGRIVRRLGRSFLRQAVALVWDAFPEPIRRAQPDQILTRLERYVEASGNGVLSDEAVKDIGSLLRESFQAGLVDGANELWEVMVAQGIARGSLEVAFGLSNPKTLKLLQGNTVTLAGNVDAGTTSLVARLIYQGVKEGKAVYGSKDSVAASIHETLPNLIGKRRAQSIALFEVNKVQSEAHRQQYQTVGLTKKAWVAVLGLACPMCKRNMARGFVEMDETFESVFGPVQGPPGHPAICHCRASFDRQELLSLATGANAVTFFDGSGPFEVKL